MTMLAARLRLYVIPDADFGGGRSLLEQTRAALVGGATAIQLRAKHLDGRELYALAVAMRALCRDSGALFLVNDRLDIALASQADGAHLGQSDLPLRIARELAPSPFLLGISATTAEQLRDAELGGADYIGAGAMYATATKGEARPIGLEGLREVRQRTRLPIVAIGGITLERAPAILAEGADGLAVISAIVGSPDIAAATRDFHRICSGPSTSS
jgi:thiamine-phosphate pyrophosphorylase